MLDNQFRFRTERYDTVFCYSEGFMPDFFRPFVFPVFEQANPSFVKST